MAKKVLKFIYSFKGLYIYKLVGLHPDRSTWQASETKTFPYLFFSINQPEISDFEEKCIPRKVPD